MVRGPSGRVSRLVRRPGRSSQSPIPIWDISRKGVWSRSAMEKSTFTPDHERLCALLRRVRTERNLPQTEVAKRLKKPQSFVSKYESGERRLDLIELREICRVIGIPLVAFVQRFEKRR